jgi:glycosyltransferase involved in cell wall biosynthesis
MTEPRKILYLENAIGWGGAAICLKLIAASLDKRKYHPIITAPHNDAIYSSYGNVADWRYIPDKKINKNELAKRTGDSVASAADYLFNVMPYVIRLLYLAKKERPDIIHLNNDPVCNLAGVLVARLLNIPCISHVRGSVTWDSWVTRWLYAHVDYIIPVAEWVKRNVINLGVPESKVKTISDGRILEEFAKPFNVGSTRDSLGLRSDQLSAGIVGLLIPWKGHKVFIEAAKIVAERYPDCALLIIGKAPESCEDYEQKLKRIVADNRLKNVAFAGHRDDIANVMRTLDIVVHASTEPDPYPNVVIEGMAAGRAVIASRLGGPVEMIADNENGVLINPGDPRLLADSICRLLENKELRLRLGREAKKSAFGKWSIENHIEKIQAVYEKVLEHHNA